jgi:hypothetical protein
MTNDEILNRLKSIEADVGVLIMHITNDEPVAEPATPQIAPGTVITLEDVRAALTKLASAKGATHVKALLADYNAKKLSDLAPINYQAVLFAAEKERGND